MPTPCLWSTRAALHRVFILPFELPEMRPLLAGGAAARLPLLAATTSRTAPRRAHTSGLPSPLAAPQRRALSTTPRYSALEAPGARSRPPQDHEIRERRIMVVGQDNKLTGPHYTDDVLRRLDPTREILRLVSPAPRRDGANGGGGSSRQPQQQQQQFAICKILDKQAEVEAEKLRKQKQKADRMDKRRQTKEIELNWAIAPHDLEHKLERMADFIQKGYRVEVMLATKKRGRKATEEEAKEVLRKLREAATGASAKEWKTTEGDMLRMMRMFLEGPSVASAPAQGTSEQE